MTKLWFLGLVLAMTAPAAFAQDEPQTGLRSGEKKAPASRKAVDLKTPVRRDEAKTVLTKLEAAIRTVLKAESAPATVIVASKEPVTRYELLNEFERLMRWARPKFTHTPPPVKVDPRAKGRAEDGSQASLEKLLRYSLIAPVGPLAAGPADTVTVKEFGDAVGFFILRLGDLTHTPTASWAPFLTGPAGTGSTTKERVTSRGIGGG